MFFLLLSLTYLFCWYYADCGEVYTWGWRECVPSGKVFGESLTGVSPEKDVQGRQSSFMTEQGMFDLFTIAISPRLLSLLGGDLR